MKSLVIIPSRLNSTRLPEKPLILIKGLFLNLVEPNLEGIKIM